MAVSKAQQAATARYIKKNYDRIEVKVKKGMKEVLENASNESLNAYVKRAIQAQYKSETGKDIEL